MMSNSGRYYALVQRGGNAVIFLSLALSLVIDYGGVGIIGVYLAICVIASGSRSIIESIRNYDRRFRTSYSGLIYLLFVLHSVVIVYLAFYHLDKIGSVEISAKRMIIAYAIFFHLRGYSFKFILCACAVGALLACAASLNDIYVLQLPRAEGVTNSVRFGMIASLFGGLSLIGFLFVRQSRWFAALMFVGMFAGAFTAIFSGSRGAIAVIPVFLLIVLIRLWTRSKWRVILVAASILIVSPLVLELGALRSRAVSAVEGITAIWRGDISVEDRSIGDRAQLLQLSGQLFYDHPFLGVGSNGWDAAVAALLEDSSPELGILEKYNQAHNQFADDFAKGGLAGGLAGVALVFVPIFLFWRLRPFSQDEDSVIALAGFVTCIGFAVFCLAEAVMLLSLPASIHAILICYLMAAIRHQSHRRDTVHTAVWK